MNKTINFIRVQSNLDGISVDKDEILTLPFDNSNYNNTIHFNINSVPQGKNLKQQNYSTDGQFIGQFVIIGTPENMPIPSGFTQADCWFRVGDIPIAEDTAIMGIKICKAVVIAPEGTTAPKGLNVLFHKGTEESRNETLSQYLKSQNIKEQHVINGAWADYQDNSKEWAESIIQNIYGKDAFKISTENFEKSLDGEIKNNLDIIKEKTFKFKEKPFDNYYTYVDEKPIKTSVYLNDLIAQTKDKFQYIYETSTVEENVRIRLQYVEYTKEIDKYRRLVNKVEESIQIDRASISIGEIETMISQLSGEGTFEIIKNGKTTGEKLTEKELSNQITLGLISKDDSIIRQGMEQPQKLSDYSEQIEIISQFKDREFLKKMAELNGTQLFSIQDDGKQISEVRNLEIYSGLKKGEIQAEAKMSRQGFNANNEYTMKDVLDGKAAYLAPIKVTSHNFNLDELSKKFDFLEEKSFLDNKGNQNNNSNDLNLK